mmetsp:Transcript_15932/g.24162  ORF Transcript_15932/g.24162 Transcript_15932/m.24162 type:complete len:299 (-) Transcript_15932:52-948(-)
MSNKKIRPFFHPNMNTLTRGVLYSFSTIDFNANNERVKTNKPISTFCGSTFVASGSGSNISLPSDESSDGGASLSSSSSLPAATTGCSMDCRSASAVGVVGSALPPSEDFDNGESFSFSLFDASSSPSRPSDSVLGTTTSSSPPMSLAPMAEERISSRVFPSISPRVVVPCTSASLVSAFAMDVSFDSSFTAISISLLADNVACSSSCDDFGIISFCSTGVSAATGVSMTSGGEDGGRGDNDDCISSSGGPPTASVIVFTSTSTSSSPFPSASAAAAAVEDRETANGSCPSFNRCIRC